MSIAVDFLPAAYRERLARARARRERLLLAIPVAAGVLATDLVLRLRVDVASQLASNAEVRAEQGEQRTAQVRQLAQRLTARQAELATALQPFAAPRAIAVLDAVVASQPAGVTLHEISFRHEPWAAAARSDLRLQASSRSTAEFEAFLTALRDDGALPALQCARTFRVGSGVGFHLETVTGPASPR
ncbi:MAG: hypothetical protein WAT39_20775 [Planctomycetota bacterium]